MADVESTRARAEPPLRTNPAGNCIEHIGSRAQLLAAGIVGPDTPFPGDPGQRKTYTRPKDDPRRIQSIFRSSPGRFRVSVQRSDEEIAASARRAEATERERLARLKAESDAFVATIRLESAPTSFDDFRRRTGRPGVDLMRGLLGTFEGSAGIGYRYAPDVTERIAEHMKAIEALLEYGTVEFRADVQAAERARLHAVAMRSDPRFDRFMRDAKARPGA